MDRESKILYFQFQGPKIEYWLKRAGLPTSGSLIRDSYAEVAHYLVLRTATTRASGQMGQQNRGSFFQRTGIGESLRQMRERAS